MLGSAYALLHLINFDEPFGLSVIEAMACGTPVIAIRRGSMSEIIEDGKTGFLVDSLDEAIAATFNIGSINRRAPREAVVQKFSVDRMVDDYINLYRQILVGGDADPANTDVNAPRASSCLIPSSMV